MTETTTELVFTEARIRDIPAPEDGRAFYSDAKSRLKLCVYASRAKSFLLYRRVQGRPERIFIGKWPDMTVEAARKKVDAMNGQIAEGKNPAEEIRQTRLEGTFSNLWELYLREHARENKRPRSVEEDEANYRRYLEDWKTRRLSTIHRPDVKRLHSDIGANHGIYAANRTLALVRKMFNFAITEKGRKAENPASGVKFFKEHSRERFLTGDEMPRFIKALADEPSEDFRHFILMDLLTGARRSNLLAMEWNEIDFAGAVWRIPQEKFKSNKTQSIPLVPYALKILEARCRRVTGQWVFPSAVVPSQHVQEFRKPWAALLRRAEITNLRPHDLRRSLGSWLSKSGAAMPIVKAAMGHQDIATTAIYARGEDADVRKALEITALKMLGGTYEENETTHTATREPVQDDPEARPSVPECVPAGQ